MGGRHRCGRRSDEGRYDPRAREVRDEGWRSLQERLREALIFSKERNGGSGIICGQGEAAGGHRSRCWRICAPEENWKRLQRALPVSPGKDSFVHGFSDQADFLLLRV